MATLARLSVRVPAARLDGFQARYDRAVAPLLESHGLAAAAETARPAAAGTWSRLFTVERPAEIVVAEVDGEWTLKRYERDRRGAKLVAANEKYPEIRPGRNLTIGGVVRGAFRRYGR